MPGRELYPSIRDERKTFRYGTNRMVEIALRHELDDVARKSLDEIAVNKERQRLKPLENEEFTARFVVTRLKIKDCLAVSYLVPTHLFYPLA